MLPHHVNEYYGIDIIGGGERPLLLPGDTASLTALAVGYMARIGQQASIPWRMSDGTLLSQRQSKKQLN